MARKHVKEQYVNNPEPDEATSVSLNDPEKWKDDLRYYYSRQGQWDRKKRSLGRKSKKKYLTWGLVGGFVVTFILIFGSYLLVYGF